MTEVSEDVTTLGIGHVLLDQPSLDRRDHGRASGEAKLLSLSLELPEGLGRNGDGDFGRCHTDIIPRYAASCRNARRAKNTITNVVTPSSAAIAKNIGM